MLVKLCILDLYSKCLSKAIVLKCLKLHCYSIKFSKSRSEQTTFCADARLNEWGDSAANNVQCVIVCVSHFFCYVTQPTNAICNWLHAQLLVGKVAALECCLCVVGYVAYVCCWYVAYCQMQVC